MTIIRLNETERTELRQAVVDAHACTGNRDKWVEHVEPVVEAIVAAHAVRAWDEGHAAWDPAYPVPKLNPYREAPRP